MGTSRKDETTAPFLGWGCLRGKADSPEPRGGSADDKPEALDHRRDSLQDGANGEPRFPIQAQQPLAKNSGVLSGPGKLDEWVEGKQIFSQSDVSSGSGVCPVPIAYPLVRQAV